MESTFFKNRNQIRIPHVFCISGGYKIVNPSFMLRTLFFFPVKYSGSLCSCIIPASVNSIKVGIKANKVHHEGEFSKNHRSRSGNGRYAASSSNSSLSSEKSSLPLYPVVDRSRSHRSKASLPPSSPMILNFCFSSPASP